MLCNPIFRTLLLFLLLFSWCIDTPAQRRSKNENTADRAIVFPESDLSFRLIGPFRGGRSAAVTGVAEKPNLFYMGATGGGVWRTRDGGQRWENISDGYFGGSIGAVAVSEWDPNVIYVGGGEVTVRGNVSSGYGMWKSQDAGKTWQNVGLPDSRHIPRVRIHPRNPDLVYAAVLGDLYKSSETRGVYRSRDGGETWERILFANADAGAVDLTFDPTNPRILYASTWNVRRTPYSLSSGGPGSALWKSTDGGDTWIRLTHDAAEEAGEMGKGLPTGLIGIIGVTVSPVNPERVWAIVEAAEGGVFRSDDAGQTWRRVNAERKLRQRAWYYSRIYADPQNVDRVYVVNVGFHRSDDGGKSWERISTPHGDHHDLWIAPEDNQRMIIGDDGGAQVSFDGGENWSTYHNQPTAQFYRVTTDDHFPFRIYAAQQDNSTVRIASRGPGRRIGEGDWESTAGGESAHIAPDPNNNEIVYGGSYGGYLTRKNHENGQTRAVNVWPDNPLGHGANDMKYRFQWNFPLFFSPHNPNKLYAASNHLHLSENGGQSWEVLSPDLTRNDSATLVSSGGPITKDNTGVEYYGTIFAALESPHEPGVFWTGSDDGLLHLSRDGGESWENVTPPDLPDWTLINSIEADPFETGGLYVAATRYKLGDYRPYLYKTKNYGKTWTRIDRGIAAEHFTRVVRADPERKGLLYAGTEAGLYLSFDDGENWQSFQLNLPIVPITDLAVKDHTLVVATQGRSLWLLDDLSPLRQWKKKMRDQEMYFFEPTDAYRTEGAAASKPSLTEGENHPGGALFHAYLPAVPADSLPVGLLILDAQNDTVRYYLRDSSEKHGQLPELQAGVNSFRWDLRYRDPIKVPGMILWWSQSSGPRAVPGRYFVEMRVGDQTQRHAFEVLPDPRSEASPEDFRAQFEFLRRNAEMLDEIHTAILAMRSARNQIGQTRERIGEEANAESILVEAKRLDSLLFDIESQLYQTKNRSAQDPLNFPIRLNNKIGHVGALVELGDYPPSEQAVAVQRELGERVEIQLQRWEEVKATGIPAFNRMVRAAEVDAVRLKK